MYQIREPGSLIASFLNYNKRNPKWGAEASKDINSLLNAAVKTYVSMAEVHSQYGGMILDYNTFIKKYQKTIFEIFDFMWPRSIDKEVAINKEVSSFAFEATKREKRANNNPFFGKKAGSGSDLLQQDENVLSEHKDKMLELNQVYENLLKKCA